MGWPRRRRQLQQQLRRRAAATKDSALVTYGSAAAALTTTLKSLDRPEHSAFKSSSIATWSSAVSPQKHAPVHTTATTNQRRRRQHTGLRQKLYSVDSLAETEPEDNDLDDMEDDDNDETASESSDLSPLHHAHMNSNIMHTTTTIPEDKPVVASTTTKSLHLNEDFVTTDNEDDDDEEQEQDASSSKTVPVAAVPAVTSSTPQAIAKTSDDAVIKAAAREAVQQILTVAVTHATSSLCTSPTDLPEAATQSPSSTVVTIEPSALSPTDNDHAPFLFLPPYFPGDVDEYERDIYETLLQREQVSHVTTDYFGATNGQPHVTVGMRAMLLDWVVEVHNHFNLQPETLYLTVNYIDRFLASVPVARENFQLVALTAMLTASKFEEVHPVDIDDLVYICEQSYSPLQIVAFERTMLAALHFQLVVPTCAGFIAYYSDKLHIDGVPTHLAAFYCEQVLLDFHLSAKYVPSVVASAALLLAQCSVEKRRPALEWVLAFEEATGYYAKDIWCCVHDISDMLASLPFDLMAVRTKYRASRLHSVADLPHVNVSAMAIE